MSEFTYKPPEEEGYLMTLIKYLRTKSENKLADSLKGAKCSIRVSDSYSERRWDAFSTTIYFSLPVDKLESVDEKSKQKLVESCDIIMPKEVGYDVMDVQLSSLIESEIDTEEASLDLESDIQTISKDIISKILPEDIKRKGKEMAEVYLYLYSVENSLRLFIEKVAKDEFGDSYFSQLRLNTGISRSINNRKNEEIFKKWISLRGDSELFYLDFKDLGTIIQNNWNLFSSYFPDQNWINTKIKELSDCRNLVAHNSFISEHEKAVIRVNYIGILRQLGENSNL